MEREKIYVRRVAGEAVNDVVDYVGKDGDATCEALSGARQSD